MRFFNYLLDYFHFYLLSRLVIFILVVLKDETTFYDVISCWSNSLFWLLKDINISFLLQQFVWSDGRMRRAVKLGEDSVAS